jgi:hypothetical protein
MGVFMPNPYNPETAIYTPQEVADYGLAAVRQAKAYEKVGIGLDIAEIRDYFAPLMPGQTCFVIAQTHHYKSGFLHFWEHQGGKQLNEQERFDEMIVHVSVEECVEEQAFLEFARYSKEDPGRLARGNVQDWSKLERAAVEVGKIPIYRIGDSLARADDLPHLYLSNMLRSIEILIEREKRKPAAIFVDYLQALPIDPEVGKTEIQGQRRLQVRQDVYRLRAASVKFRCPVIVAAQARQILQGATKPIMLPGMYDGEETSSIAQRADRIISLWMPKVTNRVGERISVGNIDFEVEENQLWLKVVKQRGGLPSGKAWPCRVDFRTNTIAPERRS